MVSDPSSNSKSQTISYQQGFKSSVPFGHYEPLLTLGVDVSVDKYLYGVRNQNLKDLKRPETYS